MKVIKLIAIVTCLSVIGLDAAAKGKSRSRRKSTTKTFHRIDLESERVTINKVRSPKGGELLDGTSSLFREEWRELVFHVEKVYAGDKRISWVDEMTVKYDVFIPKSKKQKEIRIMGEELTFTNIPTDKAFKFALFISPVVYKRYIVDKGVTLSDGWARLTFTIGGKELTKKPVFFNFGGGKLPKGVWEATDDKFEKLADPKAFILNRNETPFEFDSFDDFLTIKAKQD